MSDVAEMVRQQLKLGHRLNFFRVVTGSMEPLIPVGSKIVVSPLPPGGVRSLKTFDILLTEMDDKLYCHYLAHVNAFPEPGGGYLCVTRGLRNPEEDLPVEESKVLGLVVSHRLGLRHKLSIAAQVLRAKVASRIPLLKENPPPPSDS